MDVLEGFRKLPDKSIDMIMTSPPYWSLRDYGKATDSIWGGDPICKHIFKKKAISKRSNGGTKSSQVKMHQNGVASFCHTSRFCIKCGAWKGQLGLEPSIDLFIEHLLSLFDQAQRVLKDSGTCWVNLGDTYYTKSGNSYLKDNISSNNRIKDTGLDRANVLRANGELKPKCLSLVPFRFALGMVNRGWILRNVIIWRKPNCVPASVQDRFTVDFEYLFLFSKSRKYYFEKQYEPMKDSSIKRSKYSHNSHPNSPYKSQCDGKDMHKFASSFGRNKRCIWTICPQPLKEAHFAVFPEKLCETPINAGCPKKVCKKCGMPKLIINSGGSPTAFNVRVRDAKNRRFKYFDRKASKDELSKSTSDFYTSELKRKIVFQCQCNAGYKPGIVLDPFMGAGTTALVAKKLGCDYLGFELNPAYIKIAQKRLRKNSTV